MRKLLTNTLAYCSNQIKNNPYQILGVTHASTEDQVKSAYYKLAKLYHPDIKPQFAQKFKQINEAYNILRDPVKRSDFDDLSKKASQKEGTEEVSRSHYNTHFHYGYTDRFRKMQQQQNKRYNDFNPFANDYQKAFSNEFTRNMFGAENEAKRGRNIRQMSQGVKNTLIVISSLCFIFFLAEVMVDIYKFNRIKEKNIEYHQPKAGRRDY